MKITEQLKDNNYSAFLYLSVPLILIFYVPTLFLDFAYSDDYFGLWQYRVSDNWTQSAIDHGRPFQGTIISIIFPWAGSVAGLWKIRIIGVLILLSISHILYKEFLFFFKRNSILAAIFSVLPTVLPSFTIITAWPSTFPAIVSLALSLLAGQLLLYKTNTKVKQVGVIAFAFALLIISLMTYQAPVAACLIPWLIRSPRIAERVNAFRLLMLPLFTFTSANLLYLASFKIYQTQSNAYVGRSGISTDLLGEILWFFKKPFLLAGSTFATLAANSIRTAVFVVTILLFASAAILFVRRTGIKKKWFFLLAWLSAFPISYYSNILAAERFESYRTQSVLTLVFIFGLAMTTYELLKSKFRWVGGTVLLLVFFSVGMKHFYNDFVLLQSHDWKSMIEVVKENQDKNQINILRTDRNIATQKKLVTRLGMDEFGIPGSAIEWVTEPMVKMILVDVLNNTDTSFSVQIFDKKDTNAYKDIESLIRLDSNFNDF